MIKVTKIETFGWEAAIRGMRNPMNSWDKSDSGFREVKSSFSHLMTYVPQKEYFLGPNDLTLTTKLCQGGPVHAKFRRMIHVQMDILAPLYWFKEWDTYKIGTVANSTSTMHKIHAKEFTLEDFSHEHLLPGARELLERIIYSLNVYRTLFLKSKDKQYWWQMIQLLPSSYNQLRTIDTNYEVLHSIRQEGTGRKGHKLDEWNDFCDVIDTLPYAKELIICE